jgi:hypothetical protein
MLHSKYFTPNASFQMLDSKCFIRNAASQKVGRHRQRELKDTRPTGCVLLLDILGSPTKHCVLKELSMLNRHTKLLHNLLSVSIGHNVNIAHVHSMKPHKRMFIDINHCLGLSCATLGTCAWKLQSPNATVGALNIHNHRHMHHFK